ncbi:MAG: FGGY-family carbohydrate kinase [Chloroflexota bacterium]|nr:FGGY-family carbohydrate kinase [Chloroflexota bacterium]
MPDLVLGVDIGSSSSKAVLTDPAGRVIAMASRPHALAMPRPGWFEHDAEAVWWHDFVAVCNEIAPRAAGNIVGVCVSGIGPCVLPTDELGTPLRPAILYGIDTRAEAEVRALTDRLGEDAILEQSGNLLTSQSVGPKLLWLRSHEPDVWALTRRFFMAHTFIAMRLTGAYVLDHHSASQCDPLYDLRGGRWSDDLAQEIAPGLELPRLVLPQDIIGTVSAAAAVETGLSEGTPVAAGTIDAWAEALSVGVRAPGDLMLMYGTTMFMIDVVANGTPDRRLWLTRGVAPGSFTRAAGMATSGAITDWFRDLVGAPSVEPLVAEATAAGPGPSGLVVLPYFAGERTPIFDPRARGLIVGLTLNHGRGQLYRGLLEGTAFGARHILEVMYGQDAARPRIRAVGGGTRSELWLQIVSDVLGLPQDVPAVTIGASFGDAQLAAASVGLAGLEDDWNEVRSTVAPNASVGRQYEQLYAIYRELYPATRGAMRALYAIQLDMPLT